MATIKNIDNPVWGLSVVGYGVIVEGIAAIRQRMDLAIRTTKGTDPMRPEFGSNVFKFADTPSNYAIPNVKKEIISALQMWVPEVSVVAIQHSFAKPHNPLFEITYNLTDENLIDKLLFDLKEGTTTTTDAFNEIILQAFFPPNPNNYRYQIKLSKNGKQVFPLPNPSGYATIQEMFNWITANWFFLGRLHLLADRVVCYMNAEGVTAASIGIEVLPIVRFESDFPQLGRNNYYMVAFNTNGIAATPEMPQTFTTPGEVLSFAQTYWSEYADWSIEYMLQDNAVFSDEFSDEFAVISTGYKLVGVSHVEGFVGDLTITNK